MLIVLCTAVLLLFGWRMLLICRPSHPMWRIISKFRYAHRGYHNKPTVPENSMAAFRAAAARRWGAELDVHLMKDGNLAVIHDSSLLRTAGADVRIEDLTKEDLDRYTLEDSDERIPLLQEVLPLFWDKAPLIVELKAERSNHNALSEAVAKVLDAYDGAYCIESFDPRVVRWFRKNRPQICRGQLAENFFRNQNSLPGWMRFVMTNLLMNVIAQPDFVAYKFEDRKQPSLVLCERSWRPARVSWTIKNKADLLTAEQEGRVVIFEQFDPDAP